MTDTLALTYRPRTFDDLVGQRVVQVVLKQMVGKNKVPPVLLFDGSHGTGKTSTLRILAAALACDTGPDPCGHCAGCTAVHAGTSANLVEIDAASHGGVDDIRHLCQQLRYATADGWRVIGLDEAHALSSAAFNVLLKTIEEPPPNTVIVLLTTAPGRIPATVVSRCSRFTFHAIGVADITDRLADICRRERIDADPDLLTLIAERCGGALRDAVMALDQVTRVGITTADQYAELIGDTDPGPALLDQIASGDTGRAYTALADTLARTSSPGIVTDALAGTLRDICVLHSAATPTARGNRLDARRRLAERIDARTAVAALKVLWDHATRIRPGSDPRTAVELAVAVLTAVFVPTQPAPAAAGRPVTLAEMAAMTGAR